MFKSSLKSKYVNPDGDITGISRLFAIAADYADADAAVAVVVAVLDFGFFDDLRKKSKKIIPRNVLRPVNK